MALDTAAYLGIVGLVIGSLVYNYAWLYVRGKHLPLGSCRKCIHHQNFRWTVPVLRHLGKDACKKCGTKLPYKSLFFEFLIAGAYILAYSTIHNGWLAGFLCSVFTMYIFMQLVSAEVRNVKRDQLAKQK